MTTAPHAHPVSPPPPVPAQVVILGGGFSGAMVALHLARNAPAPMDITIVEPRSLLGGGVAYSTPDPQHRLNVPASRMSAFSADMMDFDHWLRQSGELDRDPDALVPNPLADQTGEPTTHAFPSRLSFGRYLDERVRQQAAAPGPARIRHHQRCAVSIQAGHAGEAPRYTVTLDDGERLPADILVITTSHPPPAPPAWLTPELAGDPRLITDPGQADALDGIATAARVAIMGSGLTMVDIVASLYARGHRGPITVFSRHGLLPGGHALANAVVWGDFASTPATGARALLRRIRGALAEAAAQGLPWQSVLDAVRRDGPALWAALPLVEQRRLLRHLRSYWDAHRYRMAVPSQMIVTALRARGQLEIIAARLADIHRAADGITLTLTPRYGGPPLRRTADSVLLATGPAHHRLIDTVPALGALAAAGRLRADALGLGIAVDQRSRVVDRQGRADDTLWVAGPLARGTFGELMGLPHVLIHAEQVADAIARTLRKTSAT